jgi:integrase
VERVMAIRLTDRVVQQAKAGSARTEVPDALVPGLYLVVQPSGVKSWAVRYRLGRHSRKLTLKGRYPILGIQMARDAARKALESISDGADPASAKQLGIAADDTLAAHIALYKERHVAELRSAVQTYVIAALERLQDEFPGRTLRSITKSEVVRAIDKATKRGPSAAVTFWKVTKAFFSWCEAREDDFASPARAIKRPAKEKSRDRVLSNHELKLTWEAADSAGGAVGAVVKMLILTGCRRNEVMGLSRDEITAEAIELPGTRTKNKIPHTVPLTPLMREVLEKRAFEIREQRLRESLEKRKHDDHSQKEPAEGKFVMNGKDRPMGDHSSIREKVAPAIPRWTLHDLRRSCASGLQRLGVAPHVVELALNHRSGTFRGVAGIYQRHRYEKEVRDAFEMWSQHVAALIQDRAAAA